MADGDNKVYVFDDGANKHEGMTKSEIMDTIVEMMETGQVTGGIYIDAVKEQNAGESLKFWVGTQAQYEALPEIDPYIDYKITDANTLQEIDAALTLLKEQLTSGAFKVKSAYTADDVKTSINGKAISEIFESDGKTAKKATIATADENGNNIMASYALKDDLQDAEGNIDALEGRMTTAEGDIDALEGRMTTAEGDIDALEAEQQTNAKLSQVVRIDAAQSLTDEEKTRAKANLVIQTAKLKSFSITSGWYRVAKLANNKVYAVVFGETFTYNSPSNAKLILNIGYSTAVITQCGIRSTAFTPNRVRTCVATGGDVFFDIYIPDTTVNNVAIYIEKLYVANGNPYVDTYDDWEYLGTDDTVSGYDVTLLDLLGGTNTSGKLYQNGEPVFATDPSKLVPSTANGWTQTTATGTLPSAGVYMVQVSVPYDLGLTRIEVVLIPYDGNSGTCPIVFITNDSGRLTVSAAGDSSGRHFWLSGLSQSGTNYNQITKIMYKRIA